MATKRNTKKDLDIDEITHRLLSHWAKVDNTDREQGLQWYGEAQRLCITISELTGVEYTRVAAVVAVTSPITYWTQQQIIVPLIIKKWLDGIPIEQVGLTMTKNVKKAYACLEGDFSAISGNKVSNFFTAICGDTSAITIDRWAARIALGDYNLTKFTPSYYSTIAEAYRRAAKQVGWTVRDFQAVLWVYAKRTHSGLQKTLQFEGG